MPKKLKGDPLGFFNIHSVAQHQKMKGDPLGNNFSAKKSLAMTTKTERGTLCSRPVLYVTRETFLV